MISDNNQLSVCFIFSVLLHVLIITIIALNNKKVNLNWERSLPSRHISVDLIQAIRGVPSKLLPEKVIKNSPPQIVKPKAITPQKVVSYKKIIPVNPSLNSPITKVTNPQEESENTTTATQETVGVPTNFGTEARLNYESVLASWLERYRSYPSRALRRRITGEGILYVKINSQGKVLDFNLEQSTNQPILDEAMIQMLKKAAPLPKIPKQFKVSQFEFAVPVTFKID